MPKYFTIVLRVPDGDHKAGAAACTLTPGEMIGPNTITACSLGDMITLNDQFKELIPASSEREMSRLEHSQIAPFLP